MATKKKATKAATKRRPARAITRRVTTGPIVSMMNEPDRFPELAAAVQRCFAKTRPPYFRAAVGGDALYQAYLNAFGSRADRQQHDCRACRQFIERYGNLVTVDQFGHRRSVFWDLQPTEVPPGYALGVTIMRHMIDSAGVAGVHYSSDPAWGVAENRDGKRGCTWHHFCVANPARYPYNPLKCADQAMAEKLEERGMVQRAFEEFPWAVVQKAKALLEGEQLYRGEKTLGVATWLHDLHVGIASAPGPREQDAVIWRAVATAPAGFAHVRSTMIGTLLEDLAAGKPLAEVKRAFDEKMNPLKYQRAQAAPSDGNVAQAEKVVAALRSQGAFDRRFARVEEVDALWRPQSPSVRTRPVRQGMFSHLIPRVDHPQDLPGITSTTWRHFRERVLPHAERVELLVPSHGPFIALTTAARPAAPPVLQWDRHDRRNPFSWYVYAGGQWASHFNLTASFCDVSAVTLLPPQWYGCEDHYPNHGQGAVFLLAGARDARYEGGGCLFTEQLRSEYHPVRRTLEAHLLGSRIEGNYQGSACGYDFRKGGVRPVQLRVTSGGLRTTYNLDRWE